MFSASTMDLEPIHPRQIERLRTMTAEEKWIVAKGLLANRAPNPTGGHQHALSGLVVRGR